MKGTFPRRRSGNCELFYLVDCLHAEAVPTSCAGGLLNPPLGLRLLCDHAFFNPVSPGGRRGQRWQHPAASRSRRGPGRDDQAIVGGGRRSLAIEHARRERRNARGTRTGEEIIDRDAKQLGS